MAKQQTQQENTLCLRRRFNAPRAQVFRAWTDPQALKQWFGPEGFTVSSAEIDLCIDGAYRVAMYGPKGEQCCHHGVYREIKPPEKLVFTWMLEGQPCEGSEKRSTETLVTVEFHDHGGSTEVVLTHEFLPDPKSRDGHHFGWSGSFDGLGRFLTRTP